MNRVFRCDTAAKTILLCVLAACVLFVLGCSKKQNQQDRTSPETKPQVDKPAVEPNAETKPAVTRSPADANRKIDATSALSLNQYDSLTDSSDKMDFISEFANSHPESTPALVDKALDDNDVDVRTSAMDALIDNEVNKPEVIGIAFKALKDKEEQVRQNAVEACAFVEDPAVSKVLVSALGDESEAVRTAAIQVAGQKDAAVRLDVLKVGIKSPHSDVKSETVSSLTDMSTPDAVDVLITGLKDPDPEFREEVVAALNLLVSQEFETYNQAKSWWNKNRNKFDEDLVEKDE